MAESQKVCLLSWQTKPMKLNVSKNKTWNLFTSWGSPVLYPGFALLPIVWSVGAAFGPFVGGTLSNPATLLPEVFDTPFWKEYPYFLPCLVTAILTAGTLVYSVFSLEEAGKTQAVLQLSDPIVRHFIDMMAPNRIPPSAAHRILLPNLAIGRLHQPFDRSWPNELALQLWIICFWHLSILRS